MQFFSVFTIVPYLALQVASSPLGSKRQNHDTSPYGHSRQLQPRAPGVVLKGLASFALQKVLKGLKAVQNNPTVQLKIVDYGKSMVTNAKEKSDQNKANNQYFNSPASKGARNFLPKNSDAGRNPSGINYARGANQRFGGFSAKRF
ncbi:hypothetical protein DSO57_1036884 [Entomophthora muscae]|uniref:Uncharacterized protein n=2 Tax=Entomophthora muscae TaxID=34485 RepID=A0ACC2RPP5_9FUNG|nr:hypothetical protein DSO57_1038485 [Entomophthora muscae]KAJ9067662.1 hypothetical protein DSO57_1036884 [Entomophthora muscae]